MLPFTLSVLMDATGQGFEAGPVTRAPPIRLQVFGGGPSLGATRRREAAVITLSDVYD